jgi:hypothetical protein
VLCTPGAIVGTSRDYVGVNVLINRPSCTCVVVLNKYQVLGDILFHILPKLLKTNRGSRGLKRGLYGPPNKVDKPATEDRK